jgi:hypothetical protein
LIRLPRPHELDEFDFRALRVGEVYDLTPNFASMLLICGCAELATPLSRDSAADARHQKADKLPEPEI